MKLIKVKNNEKKISKFLFTLRNKYYVRKNSITKKEIKWCDHEKWLHNFFLKKNFIYIVKEKKKLIGYVRFEKKKDVYNVSWAILKKFQRRGIMKKSLKNTTKYKNMKYRSIILNKNKPSIKIAENAKFKLKFKKNNQSYFYK